jgi:hypothetical protein
MRVELNTVVGIDEAGSQIYKFKSENEVWDLLEYWQIFVNVL